MIWHIDKNKSHTAIDGEPHNTFCGILSNFCVAIGGAEVMIEKKNKSLCRVCRDKYLEAVKAGDLADIEKLIGSY